MITAGDFRKCCELDGDVWTIVDFQHVVGKGAHLCAQDKTHNDRRRI